MSLISNKHLSMAIQSLKKYFNKEIKDSTADWNQSNTTALDYIKNKPFSEEEKVLETLLPETTLEFTESGYSDSVNVGSLNLVIGELYVVTWDGQEYLCTCYSFSGEAIGDNSILTGGTTEDFATEAPFFIWDNGTVLVKETGVHTFKIERKGIVVHQIDEKYIPDAVKTHDWNTLENKPFYESEEEVLIVPEQEFTFDSGGSATLNNDGYISSGENYIVVFDRNIYKGIATTDGDTNDRTDFTTTDGYKIEVYGSQSIYCQELANTSHTISISTPRNVVKTLDEKYLPESCATIDDIKQIDEQKMNVSSPEGSGSFSINRTPNTPIGNYSSAVGESNIASYKGQFVTGRYNKNTTSNYVVTPVEASPGKNITKQNVYFADEYMLDNDTGKISLVNPVLFEEPTYGDVANLNTLYKNKYMLLKGETLFPYQGDELYFVERFYGYSDDNSIHALVKEAYRAIVVINNYGEYSHIVGNGTSNTNRSNSYTLDWDGNAWYSGDVYVGSTSGTNKDEGSKKLATEEYVNNKIFPIIITEDDYSGEYELYSPDLKRIVTPEEVCNIYNNINPGVNITGYFYNVPYYFTKGSGTNLVFSNDTIKKSNIIRKSFELHGTSNTITRSLEEVWFGEEELSTENTSIIGAINELNAKHTEGTDALTLLSLNGTKFRITIGDDGVLTTTEIVEVTE